MARRIRTRYPRGRKKEFGYHMKKAGACKDRNVVNVTIRTGTAVQTMGIV